MDQVSALFSVTQSPSQAHLCTFSLTDRPRTHLWEDECEDDAHDGGEEEGHQVPGKLWEKGTCRKLLVRDRVTTQCGNS